MTKCGRFQTAIRVVRCERQEINGRLISPGAQHSSDHEAALTGRTTHESSLQRINSDLRTLGGPFIHEQSPAEVLSTPHKIPQLVCASLNPQVIMPHPGLFTGL
jgi:hypothetical protein